MSKRPDVLAGLGLAARIVREREDARLLQTAGNIQRRVTNIAALEVKENTFAGVDVFKTGDFKPHREGDNVDFVVCARVNLDHPIYFADNVFADCVDCDCDLQVRPHAPPGPRLCICCAARRVREDPDFTP